MAEKNLLGALARGNKKLEGSGESWSPDEWKVWCRVSAVCDTEIVFRTPNTQAQTGEAFTRNVRPSPLSTRWDILIPKNNT